MQTFIQPLLRHAHPPTRLPTPAASRICQHRPRALFAPRFYNPTMSVGITVVDANDRLQSAVPPKYLDVRTPAEFAAGHVPGAVNVPVTLDFANPVASFVDDVKKVFHADTDLLVGCKSGARSKTAIGILEKEGFQKLANVDGGYNAWSGAELPVDK